MERNEEAIEVLRYARDVVLSDESKWYQGGSGIRHDRACAMAAVGHALIVRNLMMYPKHEAERVADKALQAALPEEFRHAPLRNFVWVFNDHPDTTYADVISLFDLAIKSLEDPA